MHSGPKLKVSVAQSFVEVGLSWGSLSVMAFCPCWLPAVAGGHSVLLDVRHRESRNSLGRAGLGGLQQYYALVCNVTAVDCIY